MAVTTRDISSGQLLSASALTAGTTTAAFNRDVLDGYNIVLGVTVNTTTSICYFWIEGSIDGSNYIGIDGSTSTVNSTSNVMYNVSNPYYSYARVGFTLTSANINLAVNYRAVRK